MGWCYLLMSLCLRTEYVANSWKCHRPYAGETYWLMQRGLHDSPSAWSFSVAFPTVLRVCDTTALARQHESPIGNALHPSRRTVDVYYELSASRHILSL